MRDIVATIQAEQDVVIRAPLDACLVVQGGPGTGKTAVGLHRAAFLLYEHRELLDDEGVLVLGPNPVFLRYISQVLPSLGETAVRQTTVERLLGGRVRAFDDPAVARLKGDGRWAAVLTRALTGQMPRPADDLVISTEWGPITLPATEVRGAIEEILDAMCRSPPAGGRCAPSWNAWRAGSSPLVAGGRRPNQARSTLPFAPAPTSRPRSANVSGRRSAAPLVKRLLSSRAALTRAAAGVLDTSEQHRVPSARRPEAGR